MLIITSYIYNEYLWCLIISIKIIIQPH